MKAIVYSTYGPPGLLRLAEIATPAPADDEVLIRVHAATVNPLDWRFMRGSPYALRMMLGLWKPKQGRLGIDVAGRVEAVGKKVTRFKPGDEVFGAGKGSFAEYACAPESDIAIKPAGVTFEQAASLNIAGSTALQALKGRVQPGQTVLINGAAGGVGTFAVQIARSLGAKVTGVCSTRNVELIRSIGADAAIDYTRDDFTRGGERYDLIVDCMGNHPLRSFRRALAPKGTYVMVGAGPSGGLFGPMSHAFKVLAYAKLVRQSFAVSMSKSDKDDLATLAELVVSGKVTPVIGRRHPLGEVPQAIAHVEEGHARGKVAVTVA